MAMELEYGVDKPSKSPQPNTYLNLRLNLRFDIEPDLGSHF